MKDIYLYKCPKCGGAAKFDSSAQLLKCSSCDNEFALAGLSDGRQIVREIDTYRCPNCGGYAKFDDAANSLKCSSCETVLELAALEEHQKELDAAAESDYDWTVLDADEVWDDSDRKDLCAGVCPSCAAEFFGSQNTVATVCPYCDNAQIVVKRLSGDLKPDYVIPFKLEKKAAVAAMTEFCKGKRLLPDCFVRKNRIEEIQGVYAPFWLFDAKARGRMYFEASKVRKLGGGNVKSCHSIIRAGSLTFEKVPVDASVRMDDDYMDAIEPFDYTQIKDFHKSYLSGYMAEKYDVSARESETRAELRIAATIENEFRKTITGYKTVTLSKSAVDVDNGKISYGLFPVWILNTKYDGENHQFIMNGQTGRLVGRLPVDKGKALKYKCAFSGALGIALSVLLYFLRATYDIDMSLTSVVLMAWCAAFVVGISVVHVWEAQLNTAREKRQACDYVVPGSLKIGIERDSCLYRTAF